MFARRLEVENRTGFIVGEFGKLLLAPCCCNGEDHFSHPYCQDPTPECLQAERDGLITRSLCGNGWGWFIVSPSRR